MDNAEIQVQKHLVSFCKVLPAHVHSWGSVLQESAKSLQTLTNLCEQQRHVKRAKLLHLENVDDARTTLLCRISDRVEEELVQLKELIDTLNKCNNDLKNRLLTFERSTLNLDWERDSELIRGNGSQPSLARLLQNGLAFSNFFSKRARNISDNFKSLNLDEEKSIKRLQASFDVDLDDKVVTSLVALTQYVDNEKAII
jgi:transcriptional regulator of heat shock response